MSGSRVDSVTRDEALRGAAHLTSFGPGTIFQTNEGEVPVEWLDTSHRLVTLDRGHQPILEINRLRLLRSDIEACENLAPIVVLPGSFGPNCPAHKVRLSPGSLVIYNSPLAELHYANSQVLVPVNTVADPVPDTRPGDATFVYTQILMEEHALLMVDGLWVASLLPGGDNETGMRDDGLVAGKSGAKPMMAARPVLSEQEAGALIVQDHGRGKVSRTKAASNGN